VRRVEVEWVDSGIQSVTGWESKDYHQEHARITTAVSCGYVMAEDDDTLWLAQVHDPDHDTFYNVSGIWKPAIRKVKELRER